MYYSSLRALAKQSRYLGARVAREGGARAALRSLRSLTPSLRGSPSATHRALSPWEII